jgi:hypothetical protein
LCRHPISSAVYDEAVLTKDVELDDYKWFYSGKSDGWWGYAEEHQEELEKAYQEYLTNASENFHQMTILGKVYIIDFSRMTQRLKGTSMVRKIKRDADREEDFIKGISGMRFQDS